MVYFVSVILAVHHCHLNCFTCTYYFSSLVVPRTGLLFVIVINQGFNAVTAVLASFPREKLIVNRCVECTHVFFPVAVKVSRQPSL